MKITILFFLSSGIFTNRLVFQTGEKLSTVSFGEEPSSKNEIELDCLIKQEASFIKIELKQILKISNAEKVHFNLPEAVDSNRKYVFLKVEMSRKEDEKIEVFVSLLEEKEESQTFLLARIERVSGQIFTSLSIEIPSIYSDKTPKLIRASLPQSSKKLFDYQISYLKSPKQRSGNFRLLEGKDFGVGSFIDSIRAKIKNISDQILPEKLEKFEQIEKLEKPAEASQDPVSSNGFTLTTNQDGFARITKIVSEVPKQVEFELPSGLKGVVLEGQMVSFAVNLKGKEIELEESEDKIRAIFAQILLV